MAKYKIKIEFDVEDVAETDGVADIIDEAAFQALDNMLDEAGFVIHGYASTVVETDS